MGSKIDQRIRRGVNLYGERFDASELLAAHASIRRAYESGERVEVTTTYANGEAWVRRGRVSTTTGWRPAFILMSRVDSTGSSDVLGPEAVATRIITRR